MEKQWLSNWYMWNVFTISFTVVVFTVKHICYPTWHLSYCFNRSPFALRWLAKHTIKSSRTLMNGKSARGNEKAANTWTSRVAKTILPAEQLKLPTHNFRSVGTQLCYHTWDLEMPGQSRSHSGLTGTSNAFSWSPVQTASGQNFFTVLNTTAWYQASTVHFLDLRDL